MSDADISDALGFGHREQTFLKANKEDFRIRDGTLIHSDRRSWRRRFHSGNGMTRQEKTAATSRFQGDVSCCAVVAVRACTSSCSVVIATTVVRTFDEEHLVEARGASRAGKRQGARNFGTTPARPVGPAHLGRARDSGHARPGQLDQSGRRRLGHAR